VNNDKTEFVAEMERRFGSDEALGVYYTLETDDVRMTWAQVEAQYGHLGDDGPGTISYLPTGGSACCCTEYAQLIYLTLPGRVQIFGFANENNPLSRVAREELHPGGHDFAVVDGRYIVDPWPRLVHGTYQKMVHDLEDPADAEEALDFFGPRSSWMHMAAAEDYAKTQRLDA